MTSGLFCVDRLRHYPHGRSYYTHMYTCIHYTYKCIYYAIENGIYMVHGIITYNSRLAVSIHRMINSSEITSRV